MWYAKPGDVISFTFGTSGYGQALSRVTLTDIELNLLAVNNGMEIVDYQELRYPATTSHVNAATVTATVPAEFAGRKGFVICSTGSG